MTSLNNSNIMIMMMMINFKLHILNYIIVYNCININLHYIILQWHYDILWLLNLLINVCNVMVKKKQHASPGPIDDCPVLHAVPAPLVQDVAGVSSTTMRWYRGHAPHNCKATRWVRRNVWVAESSAGPRFSWCHFQHSGILDWFVFVTSVGCFIRFWTGLLDIPFVHPQTCAVTSVDYIWLLIDYLLHDYLHECMYHRPKIILPSIYSISLLGSNWWC